MSSCTQVSDVVPTRSPCFQIGSFIIFTIFDMIFQLLNNKYINISCNCYFLSHFPYFSNLPAAPRPSALQCFDLLKWTMFIVFKDNYRKFYCVEWTISMILTFSGVKCDTHFYLEKQLDIFFFLFSQKFLFSYWFTFHI